VPIVLKSGSLNLLEPSGPVKACNGIALPLPYLLMMSIKSARNMLFIGIKLKVNSASVTSQNLKETPANTKFSEVHVTNVGLSES
jgi:hypothetical protein